MKKIGNIILDLFTGLSESITEAFETKNHNLDAQFGSNGTFLSRRHKGLCIDGRRSISLKQNCSNAVVVGPSGKGKSQVTALPTLLRADGSASYIINDVSGELSQTIPFLESIGYKTLRLHFGEKTGLCFNPLEGCLGNISQMKKVAKTLVRASKSNTKADDFWSIAAADTMVMFIQFILESEKKEFHNLGNVYKLILEYQGSHKIIENMMAKNASPEVWTKFKALVGASDNTRKSIVASALSALSFIGDDPVLCDITSHSNINFEDFRDCENPHALFVQVPVSDTSFYAPILSLFFQEFYRFGFSRIPADNELDIVMILDEFDTMTAIADYSSIISNSRKFKIPQNLFLQSEAQLSKYGEQAKTILNNCNVKCYYGGLGEEAFQLEKILGQYDYQPDKESKQTKTRPLMTASEIREMKGEILVLVSGERPLKVKITETYKQSLLMKRLRLQSNNEREEIKDYSIEYIPLEDYKIKANVDSPSKS